MGFPVWWPQLGMKELLVLPPMSPQGTTTGHPLQAFAEIRAMREVQAEVAGRCPLAPGHSTPPSMAQIRNLAHTLQPPKFLSTFITLFPKEQAKCQCLLWPKGCPANIAQDRLTMSSAGGAPSVTSALSPQKAGLKEPAQGGPGGC